MITAPISPIAVCAVGLVALGASTWMVARIRAIGLMDHPNTRSSQSVPTPRGGGVAIAGLTLLGFLVLTVSFDALPLRNGLGYFLAAIILGVVSLLDDIRSLSA